MFSSGQEDIIIHDISIIFTDCTTMRIPLDPGYRNPINILNSLHPGIKYELVYEYGQSHSKMFAVRTILDGKIFERIGNTKKQARAKTAAAALFKVYKIYI